MSLNAARVRQYLQSFDFRALFIEELGWDKHTARLSVAVDGKTYPLYAIAEKRGFQVFECPAGDGGSQPDHLTRGKIERQVAKVAHEHIIIYVNADKSVQKWQWVRRELGRPLARREYDFSKGQTGELLVQKLQYLSVSLSEEDRLTLVDVTRRAREAFDVEAVTKRFYDLFKAEHATFLKFVKGIMAVGDCEWYASVMLNRLMFIYFIQRKGFLDGDPDYLRHRLEMVQQRKGKDKFLTFYRYFLLRLFHEGLGQLPTLRKEDLDELLGEVPYLNGGLFDVHELERAYPNIEIADEAFERLFNFFDAYQWHLDSRPLRTDNEINPDVLGYIFEKYINQKQMGAYYTKEDITGYIARNTVVPFLFHAAERECAIAFRPESAVWRLLSDDPDRYIRQALRKGVDLRLPAEIAEGMRNVSNPQDRNKQAAPELALPTETWREYIVRRQHCQELRAKLKAGEVHSIDDLVTCNLDICQFAEDVIQDCEGPELLRAFYHAIERVSVLDLTCGSGAFLFAALNILEPLYEACLDRMQAFVEELERSGDRQHPERYLDFRKTLDQVALHPNHRYFILKSIIIRNLYGVDIMEEAVEICKLRLFLNLVAQVDNVKHLEPLPDIDFNIRAGNTLVGFASLGDVNKSLEGTLGFAKKDVDQIIDDAAAADRAFRAFREVQTDDGVDPKAFSPAKTHLREHLDKLRAKLDRYLAVQYGVDPEKPRVFARWRETHLPFHWFAEFYGVMSDGGFDVIIGNPPYLERAKLKKLNVLYSVRGYRTANCRDIYAWVVERGVSLRNSAGKLALIVPISLASSGSFDVLRDVLTSSTDLLWLSHFANRPGQLFAGAQNRLTIFLSATGARAENMAFSTRYHRWDAKGGERESLFAVLRYTALGDLARGFHGLFPKVGVPEASSVIRKMVNPHTLGQFLKKRSDYPVYWVRVPGYFCQFFLEPPKARPEKGGPERIRGEVNSVYLADGDAQRVVHAVLNSSSYYQFFCAYTDGRHINPSDVTDFPFDLASLSRHTRALVRLSKKLEADMKRNTSYWRKSGLLIESVDSRSVKATIDEIDRVLAEYYGFTAEELDFILNYDIKYRMGQDADGEDEE